MTDAIVKSTNTDIVASLVLHGDMSKLNPAERVQYYSAMCERVGLDPLSQPFKILKLNGKEVLYCDRSGAAQLNKLHKVSHQRTHSETVADVFAVYMRASTPDGRSEESCGAVAIGGLRGDGLANAMMKAETKAKRRSTLDLLGLGILDETELETIPSAQAVSAVTLSPGESVRVNTAPEIQEEKVSPGDTVVPLGVNKGKRISELPEKTLRDQIAWCRKNSKYTDYADAVEKYLSDAFGGVFDKPPESEPAADPTPAVVVDTTDTSVSEAHSAELRSKALAALRGADIDKISAVVKHVQALVATGEITLSHAHEVMMTADRRAETISKKDRANNA